MRECGGRGLRVWRALFHASSVSSRVIHALVPIGYLQEAGVLGLAGDANFFRLYNTYLPACDTLLILTIVSVTLWLNG